MLTTAVTFISNLKFYSTFFSLAKQNPSKIRTGSDIVKCLLFFESDRISY